MKYAVHQPHYLPYPGYLEKINSVDTFIFLEKVQFVKREYQNRNKIKGPDGTQWLTIPVKGDYKSAIEEMVPDYSSNWQEKHEATLRRFYAKAPHLDELDGFLNIIKVEYKTLADLLIATTSFFVNRFGIKTKTLKQATLEPLSQEPNRRILEIGQKLEANTYLAGAGGRNYMDTDIFTSNGITVEFQEFVPHPYPQLHGDFAANLGSIDLLLNTGRDGFFKYYCKL
ncbi:WbqC family protein [bacterium]|nr:WbqC family protein [bacterium]